MATRTSTITVDAELATAYNMAPKLRQREALSVFRQALRIVPPDHPSSGQLSKKETALFLKINRNLSEEEQTRYDALTERRLNSKLTAPERAELEALVQKVEQIWAERWQAIGELARLRKVSPATMMQQLELDPRAESSSQK